jgi:hypothetical protein
MKLSFSASIGGHLAKVLTAVIVVATAFSGLLHTGVGERTAQAAEATAKPWEPANLIVNPGFESAVNGFPANWQKFVPEGTPEISIDSAVHKDGSASVRLRAVTSARASINQTMNVQGDKDYELSVWLKTDNIVSNDRGVTIRYILFNAGGAKIGDTTHIGDWKGTRDWTKVTHNLHTPAGTAKVMIEFFIWGAKGTVWFDSAKLSQGLYLTDMLRSEHPRLLGTASDFLYNRQLVASDTRAADWYTKVKEAADRLLNEPVVTYETPDGLRLLEVSREVIQRMYTLGMVYRIGGDSVYAERAWRELEAVAGFPDWNPRHFLDTAEMTHGVAIGYDWFYDYFSEARKQTIRDAILQLGLAPGLDGYRNREGWSVALGNWNFVTNGGLAMGALAIGDEPSARFVAEELLRTGLDSIQAVLPQLAPDGGWYEGYGYWDYATQYLTVHLAGLKTALGTDFGQTLKPGLEEAGLFPIYLESPVNQTFNFADGTSGVSQTPQLFWMAGQYNKPELQWFRSQSAAPQGLLWYKPTAYPGPKAANMPHDAYFANVETATFRSSWEDPNALFVGFKGAHEDPAHKRLDGGSFVLDALGVRWGSLLWSDDYNLPGYFDGGAANAQRWTYYRNRAEGSNTLVVNPGTSADQDPLKASPITSFRSNDREAFAIADLTPLYAGASKAARGIKLLDERRQVLIQDEVEMAAPADMWWFMNTAAEVESIDAAGKTAVLRQDGKRLWARIVSAQGEFTVMDAQPLPQSPTGQGQNANAGAVKLAIHSQNTQSLQLAVLMVPLREWETPPAVLPQLAHLSAWANDQLTLSELSGITLSGTPLAGFAGNTFTYDAIVPEQETIVPLVEAVPANPGAAVVVTQAAAIPGTAWIEVTDPGAADATRYAVHIDRAAAPIETVPAAAITASGDDGNVPANVADGDLNTRWSAEGDGQWIQYDFGSAKTFKSASIAWFKGNERSAVFDIAVSNDGQAWTTVYSGTSSGKSLQSENYNIGNQTARYLRIIGYGNSQNKFNSITELKIYDREFTVPATPNRLQRVTLSAEKESLDIGEAVQLATAAFMSDNTPADLVGATVEYFSDHPGIVVVSPQGIAEGVGDGIARVSVRVTKDRFAKTASLFLESKDQNKLKPVQATYVRDGDYTGTNFSQDTVLAVKAGAAGYNRISYLQFDLSTVQTAVYEAKLYVYGQVNDSQGSEVDVGVHEVSEDSWTAAGLNWNNSPAVGQQLALEHFTGMAEWHEIDLTDYIRSQAAGDRKASLALKQSGIGLMTVLYGPNHAGNKPYLRIKSAVTDNVYGNAGMPAKPVLSGDNGYDSGIGDGNYNVKMNMWWGANGTIYKLYENDVQIDIQLLADRTPNAQSAISAVKHRKNGVYRYYAELINEYGSARSDVLTITVTEAAPGKPILANDNWDGDGNYQISMNMWWGTNGTSYLLYENDVLIDTQTLTPQTPQTQSAHTAIRNKAPGAYKYRCEVMNGEGSTTSETMIVYVSN